MALTEKEALDIAWKYFQQHAQQRVSYFNFFVLFSSIMTTGLIATLGPQFDLHLLGTGIGCMEVLIAFVFIKIDDRNKYLTKIGEDALKALEELYVLPEDVDRKRVVVFNKEVEQTASLKKAKKWHGAVTGQISHSKSFRIIYIGFAIAGITGVLVSLLEGRLTGAKAAKVTSTKLYLDYSSAKRVLAPVETATRNSMTSLRSRR